MINSHFPMPLLVMAIVLQWNMRRPGRKSPAKMANSMRPNIVPIKNGTITLFSRPRVNHCVQSNESWPLGKWLDKPFDPSAADNTELSDPNWRNGNDGAMGVFADYQGYESGMNTDPIASTTD